MYNGSEFARNCNGRPLEPDLLPELHAPTAQNAVGCCPPEDHHGRFLQQCAEVIVTTLGDAPGIVDLTRLIAPDGQADPGADRA
jgi:hypothetical protein